MNRTKELLLCAATPNELAGISNGALSSLKTGVVVDVGKYDVLITGVGIFQTVYNLTRALMECDYEMALSVGVAGDYDNERPLCQLYSVEKSVFADCGFETKDGGFQPVAGSKFLDGDRPPFQHGYVTNNLAGMLGLQYATANTVSRTCTDPLHVKNLLRKFPADLETMESSAFTYVCARQNVPRAEIRCTSNHVVPKRQEEWRLKEAVEVLGAAVEKMIK